MSDFDFNQLPKSIKKAVRYILQDAPENKLELAKRVIIEAIETRELELGLKENKK